MNRCGSFALISAPHSLVNIWTNLNRSEKIPGAPTRKWGEWIWPTGPSGLHRNSPQGLNIRCIRVFDHMWLWVIRISESLIWSKTLMELIFNPCGEFQWNPEDPVSKIHSPHHHDRATGILSELFRCVQMEKRKWGAESKGMLLHLFILSKTATLVP